MSAIVYANICMSTFICILWTFCSAALQVLWSACKICCQGFVDDCHDIAMQWLFWVCCYVVTRVLSGCSAPSAKKKSQISWNVVTPLQDAWFEAAFLRQVRFAFNLQFFNILTVIKVTKIYLTKVKWLKVISQSNLITVEYYNKVIIVLSND